MTGRYPVQAGVPANKQELDEEELVWAGFLKNMCDDDEEDDTPCYHTGYIGKWHLGNATDDGARNALWTRGFDDAIYDTQNSRWHWATTPLRCSPGSADPGPWTSTNADEYRPGFFCTTNSGDATPCHMDSGCTGGSCEDGKCRCTTVWKPQDNNDVVPGRCYPIEPAQGCNPLAPTTGCASTETCRHWGSYLGPLAGAKYCHPDDEGDPLCCSVGGSDKSDRTRDGRYAFGRKRNDRASNYGLPLFSSDKNTPCNVSGERFFDNTGTNEACLYDTRYQRDFAMNFIARHAHGQAADDSGDRFALYWATHATHVDRGAPETTIAHYSTVSDQKGGKAVIPHQSKQFWAALEEVDAALGSVFQMIDGFCDNTSGTPEGYSDYGKACGDDDSCPTCVDTESCATGGSCNHALKNQTLVMVTSDQGTDESSFGQPWLREGKGSMYEGGIRVGLQAWSPGLGIGDFAATNAARTVGNDVIASHVDLAPTIINAAGCQPDAAPVAGGYHVMICNNNTRRACTSNDDCAGDLCITRTLEGRSLLPLLQDGTTSVRDFAYAELDANVAVVSRGGLFEERVCGFSATAAASTDSPDDGDGISNPHAARERVGGSCFLCTDNTDCALNLCDVDGQFCLTTGAGSSDPCLDTLASTPCEPEKLTRCGSDSGTSCPSTQSCVALDLPVRVKCDAACPEAASWKLKGVCSGTTAATPVEMYDLTTNPEERKSLNLNCLGVSSLQYVQTSLGDQLSGWVECTHDTTPLNGTDVLRVCEGE